MGGRIGGFLNDARLSAVVAKRRQFRALLSPFPWIDVTVQEFSAGVAGSERPGFIWYHGQCGRSGSEPDAGRTNGRLAARRIRYIGRA